MPPPGEPVADPTQVPGEVITAPLQVTGCDRTRWTRTGVEVGRARDVTLATVTELAAEANAAS